MADIEKLYRRGAPKILPPTDDPIRLTDPGACLLSVLFWSDMHLSDTFPDRCSVLRAAALDAKNAKDPVDVLTFGGDLTDFGKKSERDLLVRILKDAGTYGHIFPVYGNHDIRFRRFSATVRGFDDLCGALEPGFRPGKLWYAHETAGAKLLIMGSDRTKFEESFMSEEQFSWLRSRLDDARDKKIPALVVQHQPLQSTHNLPYAWDTPVPGAGSVGQQSERLRTLLARYRDVFYITGHLHRGFNINTYEEVGPTHCVCLPSTGLINKDSVYSDPGLGMLVEVYRDRVLFRPRDFLHGRFVREYEKIYPLEAAKE